MYKSTTFRCQSKVTLLINMRINEAKSKILCVSFGLDKSADIHINETLIIKLKVSTFQWKVNTDSSQFAYLIDLHI